MSNQVIHSIIAKAVGTGLKEVEVFSDLDFTTPSTAVLAKNITFIENVIENGQSLKRASAQIAPQCVTEFVRRDPKQAIADVKYLYAPATIAVGTEYSVSISRGEAGVYEPFKKMYATVAITGDTPLSVIQRLATLINLETTSSAINATALNTTAPFTAPALIINNTTAWPMRTFTLIHSNLRDGAVLAYPTQGVGTYDLVKDMEDTAKAYAGVQSTWFAGPYNSTVLYAEDLYESATASVVTAASNIIAVEPAFASLPTGIPNGAEVIINNKSFIKLATVASGMLISGVTVVNTAAIATIKLGYTTIIVNAKEFRNEYMAVGSTPMPTSTIIFVRDDSADVNAFVTKLEACLGRTAIVA